MGVASPDVVHECGWEREISVFVSHGRGFLVVVTKVFVHEELEKKQGHSEMDNRKIVDHECSGLD